MTNFFMFLGILCVILLSILCFLINKKIKHIKNFYLKEKNKNYSTYGAE